MLIDTIISSMLIFTLALGFVLRIISLNQSLWLDEATTAIVARDLGWHQLFVNFLPHDFHPPLYYIIEKIWATVFGNYSEVFLRLPSVMFGVMTIYLVYMIGEHIKGKKFGLVSSLMFAVAPLHIYYSQEARMYALAAMLVALTIYSYLKNNKWLFVVSLAAAFWADYLTILIVPVFLLMGGKRIKSTAKNIFMALLLCVPMLLFLPSQLSGGLSQHGSSWWNILGVTNFKNAALIPIKFVMGRISFPKPLYQLVFLGSGGLFGFLIYKASKEFKKYKLLFYWLIIPILLAFVIGLFVPVVTYFRFLFVLPALYLIVAIGIYALPKKYFNLAITTVIGISLVFSLTYLFNPKFHREDWRAFAAVTRNSTVVFPSNSQKEAYNYYNGLGKVMGVNNLSAADNEVWLVRYIYDIVDPTDSTRLSLEKKGYTKVGEYDFNGVVAFKYESKNSN